MEVKLITSLAEIDARQWNELAGFDYPFIRYEFLSALEQNGVVSAQTGWQPSHLLVMDHQQLIALMPLYQKSHSWGEYVFDQAWAQAYQQHGLQYYPKFVTSIPFTPCHGPRMLVKPGFKPAPIMDMMLDFMMRRAEVFGVSSWHCLFPDVELLDYLRHKQLILREDVQFQWFNRGYASFEDFLQTLTASKRKMVKRERRKVHEQGISLQGLSGGEVSAEQWRVFYRFYAATYLKRRMQPYLNPAFFQQLAQSMPEQMRLILAIKGRTPVAAALCFVGGDTLYGRYWGCEQDYDVLHFETCYYQGIDHCIAEGLRRFDSGAQGEHKIARGFEPVTTSSLHWIKDDRFARAITDFAHRERIHVQGYKADASGFLPFKSVVS